MITSRFIVIEHHAKRAGLHYDLRFKIPDSQNWASFAIRKGIPLQTGKKVMAQRTHDHTEEEALFIGKIEQGYGAGVLKKYDSGTCKIIKYTPRHIAIEFQGSKIKGIYHMISFGLIDKKTKETSYLLFKGRDNTIVEQDKITLSENAQKVAESRYFMEGENWSRLAERVAKSVADIENKKQYYTEKFYQMIASMDFIPGGRILRNAGRPKGSMFNCYHLPCIDSIEGIGQYLKDSLILWSEGGGVGCNFSPLRPKGDPIKGKGGFSSGLVSFIEAADAVAKTVETGGQRRAAALASVDISHPEVINFINAKLKDGRLAHFNISVNITNEFLDAVEQNKTWDLRFRGKVYDKKPAREIWNLITENMIKCAEPGILNFDNISENNSYYYDPVTGTNPCGEAVLEPYGVCNLGSIVLPNFINNETGETNWNKLKEIIQLAVRFLDDVIELNNYSLSKVEEKAKNSRRIGIGVMGLAEYLFGRKVRYGMRRSISEIDNLMNFIKTTIYETLVTLSAEKGPFPMFDPEKYSNAPFIQKLTPDLRKDIKKYGTRCVTGMAIAPTGTTSLLKEVSSGIEPLFSKAYLRKDRVGQRVYIHPIYEKLILQGITMPPAWYVDSYDLKAEDHFEVQKVVQSHVDGAVSKTINLPKGVTKEQLDNYLLKYIRFLKGVTIYVDGSRDGQVFNKMSPQKVVEYLKESGKITDSFVALGYKCACSAENGGGNGTS